MAVTWQRQDHEAATADFPPVSQSQQVNQESNRAQAPQIKETLTLEGQETHVHLNWSMRLLPPLKTSMFSTKGSDNTTHTHTTNFPTHARSPRLTVMRSIPAWSPAERSKFPVSFRY